MKSLLLLLFTFLSIPALAKRSLHELSRLKESVPYCVDEIQEIRHELYWSISNSCFMLKKNLNKRDLASVSEGLTSKAILKTQIIPKKKIPTSQFNIGLSANHYSTDVNASSIGARIGYGTNIFNSFEVETMLEIERYVSVDSENFKSKINKPVFNGSLTGLKKINKFKIGAELAAKHYIQVIDMPSSLRFDITPFLSLGSIVKYDLTDKMILGASASYLKASDKMDSKGYELKAFGSYSFGVNQKYAIIPHASITKLENSLTNVNNNKLSVLFRFSY